MQNPKARQRAVFLAAASGALSLLLLATPRHVGAQDRPADQGTSGMQPGDYLRFGAGTTIPVNPQGSLRDWKAGPGVNVAYENWQPGGNGGPGRVGFGLGVGYSRLVLKEDQFANDFTPTSGALANASGHAGILEITSNLRIRIPAPLVMPAVTIGLGFINWSPGQIHYETTTSATGSVKQSSRSGAELALGGSIDREIYDRFAAYVEAAYVYGYTSYGAGFGTPTSICTSCDPLKNTTVVTLRGGLRARIGR
jgi:hypothetical protein